METKFLLLWFEAPLQAWGADSKFGRRETLKFPTKSGVLGLVLSALGASGEQTELLSKFANLKQTVLSFKISEKKELLLEDFHMVGSGYDASDPWQFLMIPKTSEGKKAVGGGTKLTYRYYLQDTKFAVAIEVPSELTDSIAEALLNPIYDIYLGRKTCKPTDLIFRGVFESEEDAQKEALKIAQEKNLLFEFKVIDGEHSDLGDVLTLNDIPIQFGENKKYTYRRVTILNELEPSGK